MLKNYDEYLAYTRGEDGRQKEALRKFYERERSGTRLSLKWQIAIIAGGFFFGALFVIWLFGKILDAITGL